MKSNREYRNLTLEVRTADDETEMIVEGYATTFNEKYILYKYGNYIVSEQVDSKAFDECDMSDVIFQYDHEGRVFARTRNGTLELSTDKKGLFVRANLGGTDVGRQLYQEIKAGYIDRMSFGFVVSEQKREYIEDVDNDTEECIRTITKISKLFDVSAVSIPANDMTSISARKFGDGVIAEIKAERLKRAQDKSKLKLKLKLMEEN